MTVPGPNPHGASVLITSLQAATADGSGGIADVSSQSFWRHVEVVKSGTGTTTVILEGSDDGTAFYPCRYQQVDVEPRPAEANSGIALGAGAVAHVYQILDDYPFLRTSMAATAGAVLVTATIYAAAAGRA